jgi:hypothetical protein
MESYGGPALAASAVLFDDPLVRLMAHQTASVGRW